MCFRSRRYCNTIYLISGQSSYRATSEIIITVTLVAVTEGQEYPLALCTTPQTLKMSKPVFSTLHILPHMLRLRPYTAPLDIKLLPRVVDSLLDGPGFKAVIGTMSVPNDVSY
jgi:hypothetical protein